MQRRTPIVIGIILATVGLSFGLFAATGEAQGQTGPTPSTCGGQYVNGFGTVGFGTDGAGTRIYSTTSGTNEEGPWKTSRVFTLSNPIPAGSYDLTAISYDGYEERVTISQPKEIWFLELLDASGNVLATSGVTADLADNVRENTWSGGIGSVAWTSGDAVSARAVHGYRKAGMSPNSVRPVCFGATANAVVTTTTSTTSSTTTTDPQATTTTSTTLVPGTTVVQVTTTTDPDSSTTVPGTTIPGTTTTPSTTVPSTTVPTSTVPGTTIAQVTTTTSGVLATTTTSTGATTTTVRSGTPTTTIETRVLPATEIPNSTAASATSAQPDFTG